MTFLIRLVIAPNGRTFVDVGRTILAMPIESTLYRETLHVYQCMYTP